MHVLKALWESSFNPHPPRRTGATPPRPEAQIRAGGFNPHPPRRTGATVPGDGAVTVGALFQSSPAPKDGCNVNGVCVCPGDLAAFQSSPAPKDGCNGTVTMATRAAVSVSILTRPEGRVQQPVRVPVDQRDGVSILTRPEGRVQLDDAGNVLQRSGFNPHLPEGRVQRSVHMPRVSK